MSNLIRYFFLLPMLSIAASASATDLTGRFSMLGSSAQAESGDVGSTGQSARLLTADQQSLRLMLDGSRAGSEWTLHIKTLRKHISGYPETSRPSSALFRYDDLSNDWLSETTQQTKTTIGYEIDRMVFKQRFSTSSLSVGRQPIDWGSGRFWQPMNIFGSFSPTDLDTDYKPGVDAVVADWYPSAFSNLTAAFVAGPQDNSSVDNSGALYYRSQVGEISEFSLLAGSVIGNRVVGASFESALGGMGWRVEGVGYHLEDTGDDASFWIAGVDYQFSNGTLVAAEWYDNSRGATTESAIAVEQNDLLVAYGLQQQLSRHVVGFTVEKDITPLLHGGYTMLASVLQNKDEHNIPSILHQINLVYSVGNESDLLLSALVGSGRGLDSQDRPQSEFGHLPTSVTLRLRFYF